MVKKEVKKFGNSNHVILSKKDFKEGEIVIVLPEGDKKE